VNRINPDEFLKEIDKSLDLIKQDISEPGTISNIIDRSNRSMLLILKSIIKNSKELVISREIEALKRQVLESQFEIARLKKRVDLK